MSDDPAMPLPQALRRLTPDRVKNSERLRSCRARRRPDTAAPDALRRRGGAAREARRGQACRAGDRDLRGMLRGRPRPSHAGRRDPAPRRLLRGQRAALRVAGSRGSEPPAPGARDRGAAARSCTGTSRDRSTSRRVGPSRWTWSSSTPVTPRPRCARTGTRGIRTCCREAWSPSMTPAQAIPVAPIPGRDPPRWSMRCFRGEGALAGWRIVGETGSLVRSNGDSPEGVGGGGRARARRSRADPSERQPYRTIFTFLTLLVPVSYG